MGWTDKALSILKGVAPGIGSALGGPAGGLAAKFLSDKLLGKPDAPDEELDSFIVGMTPEQTIQMKELDLGWQKYKAQINLDEKKLEQASRKEQIELNKIEAASGSLFKGGWRPFVGWICGAGVGYSVLGQPILISCGVQAPLTDISVLVMLLFALLGIGGYRTAEKFKGVASK